MLPLREEMTSSSKRSFQEHHEGLVGPPPKKLCVKASGSVTASQTEVEWETSPKAPRYGPGNILPTFSFNCRPRYGPEAQKKGFTGDSAPQTPTPKLTEWGSWQPTRVGPGQALPDSSLNEAFTAFSTKASIRPFDASRLPKVSKQTSYNDDVKLEHFQSSSRLYAGKQRKGVIDEHLECLSMQEHIDKALSSPFFLSLEVPLPLSIKEAATFIKDSPPELILNFWDEQLSSLDKLIMEASSLEHSWNALIPPEIAPAAGKLKLAAFMSLALQCDCGGSAWLQQFLFGFPLVGRLSQSHCYPTKLKEASKKPVPIPKLFNTNASRFRDRASKSGFKNANALWSEALEQCEKGWLTRPFPLCSKGRPFVLENSKLNIAFRFGVAQGEKLRACDDLRHSHTNLSCVVETPIKLVSWDHLAELTNLVNDGSRDWAFFKADHEAAYKQLPLDYSHAKLAVVALRSPIDGRWYGFLSRTMMFGAISAVLHYNVFSRLLSEIVSKLLGIPLLCFFDDFGSIIPAELANRALATFTAFCSKLGITLKTAKSEVGQEVTFLGLRGSFPCKANNFKLSVTLTPDKAKAWAEEIELFIRQRSIPSPVLEKLIGKLGFSQTNLFGKFARTQLRPLYKKFYSRNFSPKLSLSECANLRWWADVLSSLQPRVPRPTNCLPDVVIYTDAALLSRRIAALVLSSQKSCLSADLLAVSTTPRFWFKRFHKRNPIIGMEMLAPLALLWAAQSFLRGLRVNLYIDNDTASNTLIRGDCADPFLSAMIKAFWRLAEKLHIDIWIGRVGSKVNPADLPTRHTKLPFPVKRNIEFKGLFTLLREVNEWLSL